VDFEVATISALKDVFVECEVVCCRFHLGQAWWRKIQKLGLQQEYCDTNSLLGKWLCYFFGLPFLDPDVVGDVFAELFSDKPETNNNKADRFADYLLETYVDNGASFPPHLWAKEPSENNKRTTNGAEAYHRSFNSMFYHSSPNIFVFLEILTGIQVTVYIKLRCLSKAVVGGRKADEERSAFVFKQYGRVKDGEMSFMEYVKSISYRLRPIIV